jgi:Family of unknown function (DUF6132)
MPTPLPPTDRKATMSHDSTPGARRRFGGPVVTRIIIAVVIGAALGAALGYFGQCNSGTCPLTSTWWRGAIYGGVLGLLFSMSARH